MPDPEPPLDGAASASHSTDVMCTPLNRIAEPLRQGDVFEWRLQQNDPWRRWGVIVTADCDLHRSKHRGVLSYVPILSIDAFLSTHWIPDQVERQFEHHGNSTRALINRVSGRGEGEDTGISLGAFSDWLVRDGIDGIVASLPGVDEGSRRDLIQRLELCRDVKSLREAVSLRDHVRALAAFLAKASRGDAPVAEERLWQQIAAFMLRLPGDAFFLDLLSPAYNTGYVACLRRIHEINASQFPESPLEAEAVDVVRISRMNAPYKYRLTQQLAAVFTDIGLPDSHQTSCKAAVTGLRST
jgi:hypothetical protein